MNELGNELAGMIGARAIKIEPEKAISYKIADYSRGTRNSKSLFTRSVLRGGIKTPEEIYNAYLNTNEALFKVQKTMADDINAAKILGMSEDEMETEVLDRIGSTNYDFLSENIFRPMKITTSTIDSFQEIADSLGISNPLDSVIDPISDLEEILGEYSLKNKNLPKIKNPFSSSIISDTLGLVENIPADVANTSGFIGQGAINIPFTELPQDQQLEKLDKVFNRN